MTGSLDSLIAATALFVASHFLLSSRPLRLPLMRALGEGGFRIGYSLVSLAAFVWMLKAYGAAPEIAVWTPPAAMRWVPLLLMPIACFLLVASVTTSNPTAMGAERALADDGPEAPAAGVISITRHPGLWGIALWAFSHLVVNGDVPTMVVTGGILILCAGGMAHIDLRREDTLGAAWGPTKLTTSVVPFAAILGGRTKLDWQGIGWQRPVAGLALYVALLYAHPWIAGVALTPV